MRNKEESDLQSSIMEWLDIHKVFYWRNNTGAFKTENRFVKFGYKGSPDIICVYGGQFVGIECKSPKGKQSENQKEFQKKLEDAGGTYILAYNIDTVIIYFKEQLCIT